jgi:radical SAM superfamily enzyme YgiQ (UPF0313 family)
MLYESLLDGEPFTLSLRPHTLTLGVEDRFVVSWDAGGRLYSLYRGSDTFRRSLGGSVLHKWRADGVRNWETLNGPAADAIVEEAADIADRVRCEARRPTWAWTPSPPPEERRRIAEALDMAAACRADASRADAAAFWRMYAPIGILPPDQYLSVVLQATHGCSFNSCTFCALHEEGYAVKTPDAFTAHARDVLAWLGASAVLRRRAVFLGAANALAVPMPRLAALLGALRDVFEFVPPVHAFVDGFTGSRKDAADYRALGALGLTRVYVGLESGHDPLLEFVRKPGRADDAVETVRAIKAGGLRVAVIVMTGLGGDRFAAAHVADTIRTLARMPLGPGDLVYFSELVEEGGTSYPRLAAASGIVPLDTAACVAQRAAITAALRAHFPAPPRLASYDVREFVY